MDPDKRMLLQVTLEDAAAADEMFSILMGEDVEQRRILHPAQRQGRPVPRHLSHPHDLERDARRPSATASMSDGAPGGRRSTPTMTDGPDETADRRRAESPIEQTLAPDPREDRGDRPAGRDPAVLPRLRDERHRRPRAARRPRRAQAGAPPRPLRDVRRRLPTGPRLEQVLPRRRRRDGSVPPARRLRDLRHPGPARAAVGDAAPLVAGQGNFGSPGNDTAAAMRYTECRMAPLAMEMVRDIDRGHGRLPAQLRRPRAGARRPAGALPEPAGQRLDRHRRRHGDQHPDAQPARGRRRPSSGRWSTRTPPGRSCSRPPSSGSRAPTSPTAR